MGDPSSSSTTSLPPATSSDLDLTKFHLVTEGKATILFPKSEEVFYNPVQIFNRDLSILAIRTFQDLRVQEHEARLLQKKEKQAQTRGQEQVSSSSTVDSNTTGPSSSSASHDPKNSKKNSVSYNELGDETDNAEDEGEADPTPSAGYVPPHPRNLKILEALSASGLRAIRYFKEIPDLHSILANDLSSEAAKSIERNVRFNELDPTAHVIPNQGDASMVMYEHRQAADRYDVIDLDPYGSAVPFLDGAVQSIADGGLLCITCTDMAILAGNHGETCYAKYGSYPVKGPFCHEMGVRILLSCISSHASRYKRYIVPLLSCSIDFYTRVFVRVFTSPSEMKKASRKVSYFYACPTCDSFLFQPVGTVTESGRSVKYRPSSGPAADKKCHVCNSTYLVGGPVWTDPMHDPSFISAMLAGIEKNDHGLATVDRIQGLLHLAGEELPEAPFYYSIDSLCKVVHANCPPTSTFWSGLLNAGFKVSNTHATPKGFKTDAPPQAVWDVMRAWVKLHPVKSVKKDSPAEFILSKEPELAVKFDMHPNATPKSKEQGLARYPLNPEPFWGPKARARPQKTSSSEPESAPKRMKQGKPPRKDLPCKHFPKGTCAHGDDCRYSHEMPSNTD